MCYSSAERELDFEIPVFKVAIGRSDFGCCSWFKEIIDMLRQRSRPYLFSNSLAPSIVGAASKVIDLLSDSTHFRDALEENTQYFREKMTSAGFDIKEGVHAIVPVMLYDAKVAKDFASRMLVKGIYVIAFAFPVVPRDKARIRTQVSAAHTIEELQYAVDCFKEVKEEMGI